MVGVIFFVIYLLTAFMARHSGRFADRFANLGRPLNITMLTGLILGGISGWFFYQNIYALAVVFYSGVYLIENLRKPIGISVVADRLEKDVLATALSAESQAETLFAALIAPAIGFMADKWGVGIALMVVSALLIVLMPLYSANVRTKK